MIMTVPELCSHPALNNRVYLQVAFPPIHLLRSEHLTEWIEFQPDTSVAANRKTAMPYIYFAKQMGETL